MIEFKSSVFLFVNIYRKKQELDSYNFLILVLLFLYRILIMQYCKNII